MQGFSEDDVLKTVYNLEKLDDRLGGYGYQVELGDYSSSSTESECTSEAIDLTNKETVRGFSEDEVDRVVINLAKVKKKQVFLKKWIDKTENCDYCKIGHAGSCAKHIPQKNLTLLCRLPDGLSVRHSKLFGGLGVFSTTHFLKGTRFGPFEGSTSYKTDCIEQNNGYSWQLCNDNCQKCSVDARDESSSNWLRYVNYANSLENHNVVALCQRGKIVYCMFKDVPPDSELLVWYSESYMQEIEYRDKVSELEHRKTIFGFAANGKYSTSDYWSLLDSSLALQNHVGSGGEDDASKRHNCPHCKYSTNHSGSMVNHLRIHSGERPFQCNICGKTFCQKGNMLKHFRIHTGERPFECYICRKRYEEYSRLNHHLCTHAQERIYQCQYCHKAFTRRSVLTVHVRTHTGERPYKCSQCDWCFRQSCELRNHMIRKHTGEFPYRCQECGKGFIVPSHLHQHLRKSHAIGYDGDSVWTLPA